MTALNSIREGINARLVLTEDLVASLLPQVRQEIKGLIGEGVTHLSVDMANVSIVDSSGIGCLVAAHNSLVQKGGCLEVENVSEDIHDLFVMMRLDRHFRISRSSQAE